MRVTPVSSSTGRVASSVISLLLAGTGQRTGLERRPRPLARNPLRRRADHDGDLRAVGQQDLARVAEIGLAVDVERDRVGPAVAPDAPVVEPYAPLDEELAEPVRLRARRLRVQDARVGVRVERRDAD